MSKKNGIPRVRWLEDVGNDLWKTEVKKWRQKPVDRAGWESVIEEAKGLRGLRVETGGGHL